MAIYRFVNRYCRSAKNRSEHESACQDCSVNDVRLPRRIVVTADYIDQPFWDRETDSGPIDPWSLPLSDELRSALQDWAHTQSLIAGSGFHWPDSATHAR